MGLYKKIGICCVSMVVVQIVKNVHRIVTIAFGKHFRRQPDLTAQGRWAVVTGGTEGVGRAFVNSFALRGLNVIIFDCNEEKLEEVAKEICKYFKTVKYNVQTKTFTTDFYKSRSIYDYLETQLKNYEIGILVNATEFGYQYPEYFIDIPSHEINPKKYLCGAMYSKIIITNILPVTHLCRIILKGMCQRKRGIIINLSSTTAEITSPMLTVYAATKSYVSKFTADLNAEYSRYGIIIQCLQPGFIARSAKTKLAWIRPSPEYYVESALRTIGIREKTCGFWPHSVLLTVFRIMETTCPERTKILLRKLMERIRQQALVRQIGGSFSEPIY